jgi:hypothetical protein
MAGTSQEIIRLWKAVSRGLPCALCDREAEHLTAHHLVPREKDGRGPTVDICPACHRQVHALFDNARLARELNTVERLRDEPQMRSFLSWVRKQDPHKRVKVRQRLAWG